MATPHTIAVAGKGGVGKTTTCGMIIDYLCKKQDGPILVVGAVSGVALSAAGLWLERSCQVPPDDDPPAASGGEPVPPSVGWGT